MEGSLPRWDKAPPAQWLYQKGQHSSGRGFGRGVGGPGGRISQGIASWVAGLGVVEGHIPDLFNFMRLRKKKSPCAFMPNMSPCNQGQKYHRAGSSHSLPHTGTSSSRFTHQHQETKKSEGFYDAWLPCILSWVTSHLHSGSNPKYLVNKHHLHGEGSHPFCCPLYTFI